MTGRIAPKIGLREDDTKILRTFHGTDGVFLIEFDVAVTSSESTEKGAAGGNQGSIGDTQPQLQPASLRLSAMISQ
jgi:hypothetical protein